MIEQIITKISLPLNDKIPMTNDKSMTNDPMSKL